MAAMKIKPSNWKKKARVRGIDGVLENAVKGRGLGGMARMWRLIKVWKEVVGETLSEKTEPIRIADHVLIVRVCDSSWAHELTYLKDELVEKIGNQIGGSPIEDIRFVTGVLDKAPWTEEDKGDLSQVFVDEKEVAATIDEKALKGKPELRERFVEMIRNTYRIRNYLNERRSRSS